MSYFNFVFLQQNDDLSLDKDNLPFITAWPYELWREIGYSCETDGLPSWVIFFKLGFLGGSRECELRLSLGFSVSGAGMRGLLRDGNISGVCLLVRDEERNELPKRDSVGVPRKLRLGEGTLLYRSMDCLSPVFATDLVF